MAIIGEELYVASISASFGISGKTESYVFSLDFLNPNYTDSSYLESSIDFLCEILFNPNVKNNANNVIRFAEKRGMKYIIDNK